jgi:hypothetical protein
MKTEIKDILKKFKNKLRNTTKSNFMALEIKQGKMTIFESVLTTLKEAFLRQLCISENLLKPKTR